MEIVAISVIAGAVGGYLLATHIHSIALKTATAVTAASNQVLASVAASTAPAAQNPASASAATAAPANAAAPAHTAAQ